MYILNFVSCPHCRSLYEIQLYSLSSGLGPSEVDCVMCRQPVHPARMEWPQMSAWLRIRYFLITLIYIIAVGFLAGNGIDQAFQPRNANPRVFDVRFTSLTFQIATGVSGLVVLLFQLYRIGASCQRFRSGHKLTPAEFLLGAECNLHAKWLILLVLVWSIAMAVRASMR